MKHRIIAIAICFAMLAATLVACVVTYNEESSINQNTSQVCNFNPIKVPLPREEVNELNDLLSMILE